jgi:hypothetical protein
MTAPPSDTQLAAALKKRSKRFALDVIRLCREFPRSVDALVVAKQLIQGFDVHSGELSGGVQNALSR